MKSPRSWTEDQKRTIIAEYTAAPRGEGYRVLAKHRLGDQAAARSLVGKWIAQLGIKFEGRSHGYAAAKERASATAKTEKKETMENGTTAPTNGAGPPAQQIQMADSIIAPGGRLLPQEEERRRLLIEKVYALPTAERRPYAVSQGATMPLIYAWRQQLERKGVAFSAARAATAQGARPRPTPRPRGQVRYTAEQMRPVIEEFMNAKHRDAWARKSRFAVSTLYYWADKLGYRKSARRGEVPAKRPGDEPEQPGEPVPAQRDSAGALRKQLADLREQNLILKGLLSRAQRQGFDLNKILSFNTEE